MRHGVSPNIGVAGSLWNGAICTVSPARSVRKGEIRADFSVQCGLARSGADWNDSEQRIPQARMQRIKRRAGASPPGLASRQRIAISCF
jgi:hypothetical protein